MDEYTRPHPDSAVLLTIDTQKDFTLLGAPAEIEGTAEAVPQMQVSWKRSDQRARRSS